MPGLATTQISRIRLHTEKTTPPRTLWVPFELGRPLGIPNDAAFQTRVLHASLKLLEATSGPIIQDHEEDAPVSDGEITTLACPVTFPGKDVELSQTDKLIEASKNEITGLRSWYDISVEKRGRTAVAASGMSPEEIGAFVSTLIAGQSPNNLRENTAIAYSVNRAIDDLRAYYSEAITAQP